MVALLELSISRIASVPPFFVASLRCLRMSYTPWM
jgi:hypothetical protein